jgi:hypothetical protein
MGMFDWIRCEYPLPDPKHQQLDFQTKDLDCLLDTYVISAAGRLIRESRRDDSTATVEYPFHGDFRFYDLDPARDHGFIEYVARFTHGRLEWIRALGSDAVVEGPPDGPTAESGAWPAPPPGLAGRPLTGDEFLLHTPEKLELVAGLIPEVESLLWLALTNVGLRRASRLVGPELWRRALIDPE